MIITLRNRPPAGSRERSAFSRGRWKLLIRFQLFGGKTLRFSELERAIPGVSQKMLIPQLRQLENDGLVRRIVHHQVPPKVEYELTGWGQDLCPALDALLTWAEKHPEAVTRGRDRAINGPSRPGER
jgi:DNA-binding HxlR family transcriptional regulator